MKFDIPKELAEWASQRADEIMIFSKQAVKVVEKFYGLCRRRNEAAKKRADAEARLLEDDDAGMLIASLDAQDAALARALFEVDAEIEEAHTGLRALAFDGSASVWKAVAEVLWGKIKGEIDDALSIHFADEEIRKGLINRIFDHSTSAMKVGDMTIRPVPDTSEGLTPMIQFALEEAKALRTIAEGELPIEIPFKGRKARKAE
jgi:hypothetical protein